MRRIVREYNLGLVLFALFFVNWVAQTYFGWGEFVAEQREHQQTARVFGSEGYVWSWARATFENWQSEFIQLFAMVALTAFLLFKGSPESKDSDEEMKEALARIERRLDALTRSHVHLNGDQSVRDLTAARRMGVAGD